MGMEVVNSSVLCNCWESPVCLEASFRPGRRKATHGAVGLALITLCMVMVLLVGERRLRRRSRRWAGVAGGESPAWQLQGSRALIAQILGAVPPF